MTTEQTAEQFMELMQRYMQFATQIDLAGTCRRI